MSEKLDQKPEKPPKPGGARAKSYFLGCLYIGYVLFSSELSLTYLGRMAWTFAEIRDNPAPWLVFIVLSLFGIGLIIGFPLIWVKWDRSASNKKQLMALLAGSAKGLGTGALVMGLTLAVLLSIFMVVRGWRPWPLPPAPAATSAPLSVKQRGSTEPSADNPFDTPENRTIMQKKQ